MPYFPMDRVVQLSYAISNGIAVRNLAWFLFKQKKVVVLTTPNLFNQQHVKATHPQEQIIPGRALPQFINTRSTDEPAGTGAALL